MKRIGLLCSVLLALCVALSACAQNKNKQSSNDDMSKKALVVYFSATGTTQRVAEMIAKEAKADIYAIDPEQPYTSADLDWTVKTSRSSVENAKPESRPAFKKTRDNLDDYDIVYLGYPIWWDVAPRIVNTFIEAYDLKGKTVIPFATSGGSTITNSVKELKKAYPDINWQEGRLLNAPTEGDIADFVVR